MTAERRHDAIALAVLLLVPTVLFLDVLAGTNALYFRDIAHYYYPAKKILRDIVLSGHFPYWNPSFSGGQPMAANPEHELFYPPNWLIFLPTYRFGFHLLAVGHLHLAAIAMYAQLRSLKLGRAAAVIGGLSFGIGGLMIGTLNLFPCLFSYAWLPLTTLYTRRYLRDGIRRDFALAALFLGLQLLGGEPITVLQTGMLLGAYAIYRGIRDGGAVAIGKRVGAVGLICIMAVLVAAVQIVPAFDHAADSARARGIAWDIVSRWSMPPLRVAELAYPDLLGDTASERPADYWGAGRYPTQGQPFFLSIYSGLLIAVACIAGLLARVRGRWLFAAIAAVSLLLSFGANTPLLRLLYHAGLARSFRYTEKFMMMGVFAAVVFGSCAIDLFIRGDARMRTMMLRVTGALTLLSLAAFIFASTHAYEPFFRGLWHPFRADPVAEMIEASRRGWFVAILRGILLVLLLAAFSRMRAAIAAAALCAFVILDLGTVAPHLAPRVEAAFYDPPAAALRFPAERTPFRVFHFANWTQLGKAWQRYNAPDPDRYWVLRNGLAPMIPTTYGLRMALEGDFDITALLPTVDFTESIGDLSNQHAPDWLNVAASMSNVWYIGVYRPPDVAYAQAGGVTRNVEPVKFVEGQHYPRYYFARQLVHVADRRDFVRTIAAGHYGRQAAFLFEPAFTPAPGIVHRWQEWPNGARLDVTAQGRAFLVMSVTPHKYWRVTIDGSEATAVVTNVGYQGVEVPAGRHLVEMRYSNPLIAAGGAISAATLLALFLAGVLGGSS